MLNKHNIGQPLAIIALFSVAILAAGRAVPNYRDDPKAVYCGSLTTSHPERSGQASLLAVK